MADTLTTDDLVSLLPSWELALRAERKSPQTVKAYGDGVRAYVRWARATAVEADLTRTTVRTFVDTLLAGRIEVLRELTAYHPGLLLEWRKDRDRNG